MNKLLVGLVALFLSAMTLSANAQGVGKHYFSTNTTNSTLVFAGKSFVAGGILLNTTATQYFVKLYDKVTAPNCGTDTPIWTIPVPANSNNQIPAVSLEFGTGIGFCITGAIADNDTTPAAAGVVVNLAVSGR